MEVCLDTDQLPFAKPADLDLHCFQNGIYLSLAWLKLIMK